MFDDLSDAPQASTRANPRLLAPQVLATSRAGRVRVAARASGEAGAAVAQAIRGMAAAAVDPAKWPIGEMLGTQRHPGARPEAQVDRMIASLSDVRSMIDADAGSG